MLQVQQVVSIEFNFEDVNVNLKLLFLKLICGTWSWKLQRE